MLEHYLYFNVKNKYLLCFDINTESTGIEKYCFTGKQCAILWIKNLFEHSLPFPSCSPQTKHILPVFTSNDILKKLMARDREITYFYVCLDPNGINSKL
jgi:hypothetical protein